MSIAQETRELAIAPVRDGLFTLIGTRRRDDQVPLHAFSHAYLRRMTSDAARRTTAEALYGEVVGAFDFADARGARPIAVRAFTPTRAEHGYEPAGSVVETNTEDLPFLLDSVRGVLQAEGVRIVRVQHPILGLGRDEQGHITAVLHPREGGTRESVMHFELDRRLAPEELDRLADAVRSVLGDVRRAVLDFPAMADRARRMVHLAGAGATRYADDEVDETVAFLEWLLRDNFIFLGYREYKIDDELVSVVPGSGLGILADEASSAFARPRPLADLSPGVRKRALEGDLLIVSKTNAVSTVHRRDRMDYVGVRKVSHQGRIIGEARMLGLFTSKGYSEPASTTPLLHRKLRQILRTEDLIEGSHDYKSAVALFNSFPKDELFAAPTADLRRAIAALLALEGDQVRLLARRAVDGRSVSLIVALPAGRYHAELLDAIAALARRRFGTDGVATHTVLEEGKRVRVHVTVHAPDDVPDVPAAELEREVIALTRTWDDRLRERLASTFGAAHGGELAARWAPRFPEYYRASVEPALAVGDVVCFDRLEREGGPFVVGLQNEAGRTRVAVYKTGGKIELADAMPTLEHLGLRVIEEVPTRLHGGDGDTWIQDFGVLGPDDRPLDLDAAGDRIGDCIAAVLRGDAQSDTLNRLVVLAGLDWRQVAVLRAYRMYRQRIGSRFTQAYQNDVLAANPGVTAKLVAYFERRFDPARRRDPEAETALRDEILADLDAVTSLDHDRILRNQLGLIDATLRTNAFRPDRGVTAFKLRSAEVPAMPQPAPLFEIYVYSPEMEGIHLRGGKVARGGIRWSERQDYRTEVHGLMRAQMTKNAVIVPAGAKGGFYVTAPPADPAARMAEVERQYVRYIEGLLELTDDLVDGEVVHPPGVRVLDDDDTYLVVAADKGTATLSDTANRISEERGFWLGDAFASGGSTGYDHKALGITARGAWESVKRHFRRLGVDPATDPFTVVGIGDMSGDVFGNGMLLSDRIRLVGAYDHRHVFIDPDPDPAAGFAERTRLFALPGSSWGDYDRAAVSEGGGVWPRSAKSIPLSPQARAALGVEAEQLPPNDVIRAILRAPVDLLWNGGIGTVVKASAETDADAMDRASDAIRVDARDLRCRVVGEGGNLGFTRRARVEYAEGGGLIYADFIDNSGGVDCSDHEVNLKILLGLAERHGELTRPERDALLRDVTGDVVDHVLYDSFLQAQILAEEVAASRGRLYAYEDLMTALEAEGLLDRALEALPTAEEMGERRRADRGMEAPELAVLLAYAKRSLARSLLAGEFPDDPWLERDLRGYFPAAVVERFGHLLAAHPLRRELIATINANQVVNSLGPTFVSQLAAERGAEPADVVRAFRVGREVTGAAARWDAVERLPRTLDPAVSAELMAGVDRLVEAATRWYVTHDPQRDLEGAIARAEAPFARLVAVLPDIGAEPWRERRREAAEALRAKGVPEEVAWAHAMAPELQQAPDIVAIAEATGRAVEEVTAAVHDLGARLEIVWLLGALDQLPQPTRTQRWATQAVREDCLEALADLARSALARADADVPAGAAVEAYLEARGTLVRRLAHVTHSLTVEGPGDLPGLMLAVRALRALAG
ncbi:MAG TPA: NAD-glutamate dehydrogenase [Solirubrobacteraceae bacterium]|nr:NAD-glutamate dehydrogenase [Solirubrobacteraceae bacterium]